MWCGVVTTVVTQSTNSDDGMVTMVKVIVRVSEEVFAVYGE